MVPRNRNQRDQMEEKMEERWKARAWNFSWAIGGVWKEVPCWGTRGSGHGREKVTSVPSTHLKVTPPSLGTRCTPGSQDLGADLGME